MKRCRDQSSVQMPRGGSEPDYNRTLTYAFFLALFLFSFPVTSIASVGVIDQMPLFLKAGAEPNVLLLVDDSSSMISEMLLEGEYPYTTGGKARDLNQVGDYTIQVGDNDKWDYTALYGAMFYNIVTAGKGIIFTQKAADAEYKKLKAESKTAARDWKNATSGVWRARNHNFNTLYYNPGIDYEPWEGFNEAKNRYQNANFKSAMKHPFQPFKPMTGFDYVKTYDLSKDQKFIPGSFFLKAYRPCMDREPNCTSPKPIYFVLTPAAYWVWEDTSDTKENHSNGRVDADDRHTRVVITTGKQCSSGETPIKNACFTRLPAEEKQNFANWWQYYRTRLLVMQGALARAVSPMGGLRMGISTLHHNSDEETKQIEGIGVTDSPGSAKRQLMNAIFKVGTLRAGTPLRASLREAGKYFQCGDDKTSLFDAPECPVKTETGGECQKNFTILVTDGFSTERLSGSYGSGIGNADGDGSPSVPNQFDGGPYADDVKTTLADVAMHYYERDLHPDMANKVPVKCGVDQNPAQHMVTYTIGFGISGTLSSGDLPPQTSYSSTDSKCTAKEAPQAEWPKWGDPDASEAAKSNELIHAAYNGRGEFISASRADTLAAALKSVLESAAGQAGSAASVAFSSGRTGTDSALYFAKFNPSHWNGDLESYTLTGKSGKVSSKPVWSAATLLDQRDIANNPRVIVTYDRKDEKDGIPFTWDAIKKLGPGNPLYEDLTYGGGKDNGEERLNYLRGKRDKEDDVSYRKRSSRLGDIVHSGPVYVGKPELDWPDTVPFPTASNSKYSDFRKKHTKGKENARKAMVYVGANDGMLHGFDAATGQEELAYIPGALYSDAKTAGLHYLTDPQYNHRYYVDMTPGLADAYIKRESNGARSWTTTLVGSLGGGGRGIFALNVTDPSKFSEKDEKPEDVVLWEFTSQDDSDLGYTYSKPAIVLTNAQDGSSNKRWAVIFGNGYNGSDTAKLFILFIEEGLDGTWSYKDGDYLKLDTGVGKSDNKNGLSSVSVVDTNGDRVADRVYAGDLQGNMWAFDISGTDTSLWSSAYKSGSNPQPLFTGNSDQPITTAPVIIDHPTVARVDGNAPNLMVYFGTGQYLTSDDIVNTDVQSYYAVWDRNRGGLKRNNLQSQTLRDDVPDNGVKFRLLTSNSVEYEGVDDDKKEYGWRIDFKKGEAGEKGERIVTDSVVRGKNLYFNTMIPSLDACTAGGDSWKMVVDLVNGGEPKKPAYDYNNDGKVDAKDVVNVNNKSYGIPSGGKSEGIAGTPNPKGNSMYGGNSKKPTPTDRVVETLPRGNQGRISWEQLFDF